MKRTWIQWSAAAAAVLVCSALVWLYLGSSSSVAWAAVAENFNRAQTLSLKIDVYQGDELREQQTFECFADRARVSSKDSVVIFDLTSGKSILLFPEQKQALALTQDDFQQGQWRNWLAELKKLVGNKAAKEIGARTIERQPCKGWQVGSSEGIVTVWANDNTAEIVLVEIQKGVVCTVMSDFRFNPSFDQSQFSLDLPKGYTMVVKTNYTAKDASNDDLLLLLRAWAGGNGGRFPDSLANSADWMKAASKYDWSKEKQDEVAMTKAISRAFSKLYAKQDWVYRGKGVKLGDAKSAIFWAPAADGKYRVIYGDLSTSQVDKSELPKSAQ